MLMVCITSAIRISTKQLKCGPKTKNLWQSILGLTYNFKISVCYVVVHHSLSRAGVATFVPNLDVLYSQVSAAIITLNNRTIKEDGREKGRMKRVRQSCKVIIHSKYQQGDKVTVKDL